MFDYNTFYKIKNKTYLFCKSNDIFKPKYYHVITGFMVSFISYPNK